MLPANHHPLLFLLALPLVSSIPQETITTTITSSPSGPSASPQYTSDQLFKSSILNSTNFFRTQHAAQNVAYNSTLASFASNYLSAVKSTCKFAHSGGPYGENLAIGYQNVVQAVDAWGNERRKYNFDNPGFTEATGHFTQLVWKNTTAVGCGRIDCGEGKGWYLVCEYWPRGNVIGEFGDMVGRPVNGVDIWSGAGRVKGLGLGMMVGVVGAVVITGIWL